LISAIAETYPSRPDGALADDAIGDVCGRRRVDRRDRLEQWWVSTNTGAWNGGATPHQPVHSPSHGPSPPPNIVRLMMKGARLSVVCSDDVGVDALEEP